MQYEWALADSTQATLELWDRLRNSWAYEENIIKGEKAVDLINQGADLADKDSNGKSLFECLIKRLSADAIDVIDAVKKKDPNINLQTAFGLNLLADMNPQVLQALLDNGANPDRCFPESDSANCPRIAENGNYMERESLDLILKSSAHMVASERVGYADKRGQKLLKLLLYRIANKGELPWLEFLQNLINQGLNLQKGIKGNLLLTDEISSILRSRLDAADLLLKNGVEFEDVRFPKYSPEKLEEIVNHNLGHLAAWYFERPNFRNGSFSEGKRSLEELAVLRGSADVLKAILNHAHKHNRKVPYDKLLKLAIDYEQPRALDILLKEGGSIESTDASALFVSAFRAHSLPSVNALLTNRVQASAFLGDSPDLRESLRLSARTGDYQALSDFFSKAKELFPQNRSFLKTVCDQEVLPHYRKSDEDALKHTLKRWVQAFGSEITQKRYNQEFRKAVAETVEHLSGHYSDPLERFDNLLSRLGERRNKIATILNHDPVYEFGKLREVDHDLYTPMQGPYEKYRKYLTENSGSQYGSVETTLEGSPIKLTRYGNFDVDGISRYGWIHTSSENLPALKRKISKILNETLNPMYSIVNGNSIRPSSELDSNVADLVWWLSQATFFYRGSAAITDILRNAVYQYHGYDGGKWKQDVCSDCYALCTPTPEKFRELYLTLKEPTEKDKTSQNVSMCDKWFSPNLKALGKSFGDSCEISHKTDTLNSVAKKQLEEIMNDILGRATERASKKILNNKFSK